MSKSGPDLLERCVFIDTNAPDAATFADIPAREMLDNDETG